MNIVFLGWGSLIWDPRELKISGSWKKDGPCLPIEFARISMDKRLTLVLHPDVNLVKTLWAHTTCRDLKEAVCNLAEREGTSKERIGFVSIPDKNSRCNVVKNILPSIESWVKQKQLDAVAWTDLPSNLGQFNFGKVQNHLKSLKGEVLDNAESYVRKAPRQIRTKFRTKIEKEFGWTYINNHNKARNWSDLKRSMKGRVIKKATDNSYWIVVPKEPCTFGHLLVISWKGYQEQDITDEGLFTDSNHMQKLMRAVKEHVFTMKSCLTYNGKLNGKKCEKVYIISECETKNFPFHFHLIPRFECEKTGNLFLLEKEFIEARWISDDDKKQDKIKNGFGRIAEGEVVLNYNKLLLLSGKWARSDEERDELIKNITKWWNGH